MKTIPISCFIVWIYSISINAQTSAWEDLPKADMAKVFEQMSEWNMRNTNYSVMVTHASYESDTTGVPFEKSMGFFRKVNDNYHSFLLGIHTIQNSNFKITLDTSSHSMLVANTTNSIWNTYTKEDYEYILEDCKTRKVMNLQGDMRYRLEYDEGHPLERYEFLLSGEGFLKELVWFYSTAVQKDPDNENSEKVKPRLSVIFSSPKPWRTSSGYNEFDESNYFVKSGNKLVPTGKYKNYSLSDQRLILN